MFWLWDRMVFFPLWVCMPNNVVLCHTSLLLEQSQRPEGTSWTSCICNCCTRMFDHIVCHSSYSSIIARPSQLQLHSWLLELCQTSFKHNRTDQTPWSVDKGFCCNNGDF